MKEIRSIFIVILLVVGSVVLYKTMPAYWADYKLGKMLDEQAVIYTYQPKSDAELPAILVQKAEECGVALDPTDITVERTASTLGISINYEVKIDMPVYPFMMHFKTSTKNNDVMK